MKKKETEEKKKPNVLFWSIFIIMTLILVTLLITLPTTTITCYRTVKEETQVPYEEQYYEDVPYTDTKCNDVPLKYLIEWGSINTICINEICDSHEQYCVEWNWLHTTCNRYEQRCTHNACTKYQTSCNLKIENIDDESGTWTIKAYSWNQDINQKGDFVRTINTYVNPTKSGVASWNIVYNAGESRSCWYTTEVVPTKSVCKDYITTKQVLKTKTVTRIEMKDVIKPYNKEVNWLFVRC